MNRSELVETLLDLGPCLLAEYRGSLVEEVKWVDKTDGKAKPYVLATHLFEFGGDNGATPIRVDEPIPGTVTDTKEVNVSFVKGVRYLLKLSSCRVVKGSMFARLASEFEPILFYED